MASQAAAQAPPQLLPYTAKLLAGGGPNATFTAGATCPVAGAPYTATDVYGDGCLATEIAWTGTGGPRYAIADKTGTVFVADYTHGLIRRIDPLTGIITVVAGGATTSPAKGVACGTALSTDPIGDGCLSTAVHLGGPTGMVFDKNGNLYFSDTYSYAVRMIAATAGVIPTAGGTISLIAGTLGGTSVKYGYTSGTNAATASYLDGNYSLALDSQGDLIIAEQYEAILVVNLNVTGTTIVGGISIPAGQLVKIAGSSGSGSSTCAATGCAYGTYVAGNPANTQELDASYAASVDPAFNVYFNNEYNQGVAEINGTTNNLTNYAAQVGSYGTKIVRGKAGTFAIGSNFGMAMDTQPLTGGATASNLYITDNLNGLIWRVDGAGQEMYVVAGSGFTSALTSAGTPCGSGSTILSLDTFGDGCPATQAYLGHAGTTYSSAGVYGVTVDANANLYLGDTVTNTAREISSGTQFGVVGANQPTQTVDIHFAVADAAAATGAYSVVSTPANSFSLGTAACTTNSDNTTDCLLPVTATPSVTGAFTGLLTVVSQLGGTSVFPLSGNYVQSPVTRTALTSSAGTTCSGNAVYSSTTVVTLTAKLAANGPSAPTGTIVFKNGSTIIGPTTGVTVTNIGTVTSPVYGAVLAQTFPTIASYSITAIYSGDGYYKTSTSSAAAFATSSPGFTAAPTAYMQSTVTAGQTALYSINLNQNVYTGTISFSCSGLPAQSSCVFGPTTVAATGCSLTSVVAVSVLTTANQPATPAGIGGTGRGRLQVLFMVAGLGMALMIGLRRRKVGMRFGQVWMALALLIASSGALACNAGQSAISGTPSFNNNFTVNITGSDGTLATVSLPLKVN